MDASAGLLIAFEGLDQSGKQTQAHLLGERLASQRGREPRFLSFPDYTTAIGQELERALAGERAYGPDVMQLLFVANRHERKPAIERWLADGRVVICDRYRASSVAYGEANGLDPVWLEEIQQLLPQPDLTILLDIAPGTGVGRKTENRDQYERDLEMLERVRTSYLRQVLQPNWVRLDGARSIAEVAADVFNAVAPRLARL
jgi:dTMP kinase